LMNPTPTKMAAPMRPRTTTSPSPKLGADLGAHKCYRNPIFASDTPASTRPTSTMFSRGQSCGQPRGLRVSASPSSGTLTDRVWSRRLRCALQGGPSSSRSEPAPGVRATSSPNSHPRAERPSPSFSSTRPSAALATTFPTSPSSRTSSISRRDRTASRSLHHRRVRASRCR
jgi:hypothetical protein